MRILTPHSEINWQADENDAVAQGARMHSAWMSAEAEGSFEVSRAVFKGLRETGLIQSGDYLFQ